MAETLQVNIVTPSALFLNDTVDMIVVPGADGDFGVMKDHVPFVSTLRAGLVEIYKSGKISQRFFVSAGFAETHGETCTVLAEEVADIASLNKSDIDASLTALRKDLDHTKDDAEIKLLEEKIALEEAKLSVIN